MYSAKLGWEIGYPMLSGFFFSKLPMVKLMRYLSIVSVLIYLTTSCFMTLRSSIYQQVTCLIIISKRKVDFWDRNPCFYWIWYFYSGRITFGWPTNYQRRSGSAALVAALAISPQFPTYIISAGEAGLIRLWTSTEFRCGLNLYRCYKSLFNIFKHEMLIKNLFIEQEL